MNLWKLKYINGVINNLVWVGMCVCILIFKIPEKLEAHFQQSFISNVKAIVLFFAAYVLIQLVFDIIGMIIHKKEIHHSIPQTSIIKKYLKGIYIHFGYLVLTSILIKFLSSFVGWWFGIIIVLSLMSLQLSFQLFWARSIGNFKYYPFDNSFLKENLSGFPFSIPNIVAVDNTDFSFTGGFTGDKGNEKLIIPASWIKNFNASDFQTQIIKRISALHSGAKRRGIIFAYVSNALLFVLSCYLSNFELNTISGIVNTICFFTILHFFALMILNKISQRGVNESDVFAFDHKVPFEDLESSHEKMDDFSFLNNNSADSNFFHLFNPIPSAKSRLHYLKTYEEHPWGAWNASRLSLYLSWSCLSLLSRSDFFQIGRPELWVIPVVD